MTTKKNKQNYVKPSVMVVELREHAALLVGSTKVAPQDSDGPNADLSVTYNEELWISDEP